MAGQSAKKIAKETSKYRIIYLIILSSCILFHFLFKRLYSLSYYKSWDFIGISVIAIIYIVTYSGIVSRLKVGAGYSIYQDIFIVNTIVALLSIFSKYAWYIYLVIPGYLIYKTLKLIITWVFTPEPELQMPRKIKGSHGNRRM
ncbi:uncharacterized protein CMU_020690 [Cryptosporidium muris RN66]|uniref:Uncharacterized protein n=1 Tax=Cryptosporidium muris (strain RN66) TaxID=441375 RepID=B6AJ88_CRYMR|nr:uncharacterized protein CMU_020690 [Cryptosporidium muris RN66]EEA08325.1 hypothetical protein, conserved [Cryptosporidium muris RN66]|eukprot:XP_002142674.1 hypothetical protein [Cryptosporidium muris RN66]